ncbi:transposase [Streptomyces inhibens]|uniref:transposase n=1 Tax=Streptomyces inhibens TaxID=2293571 RepID=UPI00368D3D12
MAQATRTTPCLPAQRIEQLTGQIHDLERRPARLVKCHFPQLLIPVGIGPDSAVTLLITMGENPERLGGEASFAALCGVSPIERSSGRHHYRRLNRGGDRQANAALHRIVQARLRFDPRTQGYYERRIKEGLPRALLAGARREGHPACVAGWSVHIGLGGGVTVAGAWSVPLGSLCEWPVS